MTAISSESCLTSGAVHPPGWYGSHLHEPGRRRQCGKCKSAHSWGWPSQLRTQHTAQSEMMGAPCGGACVAVHPRKPYMPHRCCTRNRRGYENMTECTHGLGWMTHASGSQRSEEGSNALARARARACTCWARTMIDRLALRCRISDFGLIRLDSTMNR